MERLKTSAVMLVALLLCSGASLTKSLRLRHTVEAMNTTQAAMCVAVGVPFRITASRGLSVNPLEYAKGVVIDQASVDDALLTVESWDKSTVLLRGLAPGEGTVRVKAKVGLLKESASLVVRTAVPTSVTLEPRCGAGGRAVWSGQPMLLEEKLFAGPILVMSDRYPEVDFGPFTAAPSTAGRFKAAGEPGALIGPIQFEVTAPVRPGPAVLRIPEFRYDFPVEVFDAAAVTEVRLEGDRSAQESGKTSLALQFVANNQVPCGRPWAPIEITVGPYEYCELEEAAPFKRLPERRSGFATFEGVVQPQGLSIRTRSGGGDCEVSANVKGATVPPALFRVMVVVKPKPKEPSHKGGGGPRGGGHH
jgi:hypothetical protein